jgi:hypothetical protein
MNINAERRTPNAGRRTPDAERQTPNADVSAVARTGEGATPNARCRREARMWDALMRDA